ncbi:hypothetical protein D1007_17078 [Hordeum vulgare]|nr:hypothetical protein D1007_17078 [Hordeum vulgare]
MGYFAPFGAPLPIAQQWSATWAPPNAARVLVSRLAAPHQAYPVLDSSPCAPQWDQQAMMSRAFANMHLQQPPTRSDWYMDTGETSHVVGSSGNVDKSCASMYFPSGLRLSSSSMRGPRLPVAGPPLAMTPASFCPPTNTGKASVTNGPSDDR